MGSVMSVVFDSSSHLLTPHTNSLSTPAHTSHLPTQSRSSHYKSAHTPHMLTPAHTNTCPHVNDPILCYRPCLSCV